MALPSLENLRVAVIGLGYVGLPLALQLARHYEVTGFDISEQRAAELRECHDRTGEVSVSDLRAAQLHVSHDPAEITGCDVYVVTVPTPVDAENEPDLSALKSACEIVGGAMAEGAIIVFESTVFPGVTEDICGPALAAASGMTSGSGFALGYSPERINPGDREHTVERICKVVAGQTPEVTAFLSAFYGALTSEGVFAAKDIKTAEAAKVIENAQRDINIAFVNEISMIFSSLGLKTHDVLAAARTKWNFLDFQPGLVGGHCIGVDPFYLAHLARNLGHNPEVILAGRRINDGMALFAAEQIDQRLGNSAKGEPARILVLGLTFKENVPDLRNSKAVDLIRVLCERGHQVDVHDPMADPEEALSVFGLQLLPRLDGVAGYDCVVGTVPHAVYLSFSRRTVTSFLKHGGLVADLKGMWRHLDLGPDFRRWEL